MGAANNKVRVGMVCMYSEQCYDEGTECCDSKCHYASSPHCLMDGGHWINEAQRKWSPGEKYISPRTGEHPAWVKFSHYDPDNYQSMQWISEGETITTPTSAPTFGSEGEAILHNNHDSETAEKIAQYLPGCNGNVNCATSAWISSMANSVQNLVNELASNYIQLPKDVLAQALMEHHNNFNAADAFLRKWWYSNNYTMHPTKEELDDLRQQLKAMKESRILGPKIQKLRNYCTKIENIDLPFQTYKQIINDHKGDADEAVHHLNTEKGCASYKKFDLSKL